MPFDFAIFAYQLSDINITFSYHQGLLSSGIVGNVVMTKPTPADLSQKNDVHALRFIVPECSGKVL